LSSQLLPKNIKTEIYLNVMLPVVLYGCETWSHIREECWQRVFENRVLKKVFGLEREEVTGGWRKLHKVVRHDLYF